MKELCSLYCCHSSFDCLFSLSFLIIVGVLFIFFFFDNGGCDKLVCIKLTVK